MLEARAETARKVSAQELARVKAASPLYGLAYIQFLKKKHLKNNTKFNFTKMIALTVCWKRAPKQRARCAHQNRARVKAASPLYGLA